MNSLNSVWSWCVCSVQCTQYTVSAIAIRHQLNSSLFFRFLLLFAFALPEFVTILTGVSLPVCCLPHMDSPPIYSIGNDVNDFLWHSKRVMKTTCIFNVHLNSMNDRNIRSSGRYRAHVFQRVNQTHELFFHVMRLISSTMYDLRIYVRATSNDTVFYTLHTTSYIVHIWHTKI